MPIHFLLVVVDELTILDLGNVDLLVHAHLVVHVLLVGDETPALEGLDGLLLLVLRQIRKVRRAHEVIQRDLIHSSGGGTRCLNGIYQHCRVVVLDCIDWVP
jgi:hypothetical protein